MELAILLLIGVPAQVAVFALVPLAWWLQAGRSEGSFLRWLGFRRIEARPDLLTVIIAGSSLVCFCGTNVLSGRPPWPASYGGFWLGLTVVVTAFLQTSLSEELFFRGFLLRWLTDSRWLRDRRRRGPVVANLMQAVICGVVRMVAQWVFFDRELASWLGALAAGAVAAFLAGWLRQRTGSLYAPWLVHGVGNLLAGLIVTL
ncbi:MAG: CPBP family intramembrane metalloprotease [Micropruina sp.]|uniref:CPBP family glutamic-type intramembrane protease n=1 Tax=Micropruina sp. TaxID=2737536 RepID=UPI0039E4DA94